MPEGQRYQILHWEDNFEIAKSKAVKCKNFGSFPLKQNGLGYQRLLRHSHGAALYGAFVAVVITAHRQPPPRNGWLTEDGSADGRPLSVDDLAAITRVPANTISRMLAAVTSSGIGWIRTVAPQQPAAPPKAPPPRPTRRGGSLDLATVTPVEFPSCYEEMRAIDCPVQAAMAVAQTFGPRQKRSWGFWTKLWHAIAAKAGADRELVEGVWYGAIDQARSEIAAGEAKRAAAVVNLRLKEAFADEYEAARGKKK